MPLKRTSAVEGRPGSFGRPRAVWILLTTGLLVAAVGMQLVLPIYRERAAIQEIQRTGGIVVTEEGGPDWLRRLLGNESMRVFDTLYQVWFPDFTDADFARIDLGRHKDLTVLSFSESRVSDEGLIHLKELANVKYLYLDDTQITDAGIKHLKHLRGVLALSLCRTKVTANGIAELKRALPQLSVVWGDCSSAASP